jgi:hypothetical protein
MCGPPKILAGTDITAEYTISFSSFYLLAAENPLPPKNIEICTARATPLHNLSPRALSRSKQPLPTSMHRRCRTPRAAAVFGHAPSSARRRRLCPAGPGRCSPHTARHCRLLSARARPSSARRRRPRLLPSDRRSSHCRCSCHRCWILSLCLFKRLGQNFCLICLLNHWWNQEWRWRLGNAHWGIRLGSCLIVFLLSVITYSH